MSTCMEAAGSVALAGILAGVDTAGQAGIRDLVAHQGTQGLAAPTLGPVDIVGLVVPLVTVGLQVEAVFQAQEQARVVIVAIQENLGTVVSAVPAVIQGSPA